MNDPELIDLTQDRSKLRELYAPPAGKVVEVDVPCLPFAMLDGNGPPEQASIAGAVKALYTAIYPIRREARARLGKLFVEAPVEILYSAQDMRDLAVGRRDVWHWRVQVTLPTWAKAGDLEAAVNEMRNELGPSPLPRWEAVTEGKCMQVLHVGKTDDIPEILKSLCTEGLPRQGLEPSGPYHEIYLDDWSRVVPDRRRVILRLPVRKRN